MTINTAHTRLFDTQLLVLDPDLEQLLAEVEEILCESLARKPAPPQASVLATGTRARANPVLWKYFSRLRGRRPANGRATPARTSARAANTRQH